MLAAFGAAKHVVRVRCLKCRASRDLDRGDLERIAVAKGSAFSLYNKRTRCRLTTDCTGWNVFGYSEGFWVYHLYDQYRMEIWGERDRLAEARSRKVMIEALREGQAVRETVKAAKRH